MFGPRKPDPKVAKRELKNNIILFAGIVVTARVAPLVFHVAQSLSK
jgi:hypothetical protein